MQKAADENITHTSNEEINIFLIKKYPAAITKVNNGQDEAVALSPILYTKPFPSTRLRAMI